MADIEVDPDALRTLGGRLRGSAVNVGAKAAEIDGQDFGPAQAGKGYPVEGRQLDEGLARLTTWLKSWPAAVDKTGAQMVAYADAYQRADEAMVRKIKAAVI